MTGPGWTGNWKTQFLPVGGALRREECPGIQIPVHIHLVQSIDRPITLKTAEICPGGAKSQQLPCSWG